MRFSPGLALVTCLVIGVGACGESQARVEPGMGQLNSLNPELASALGCAIQAVEEARDSGPLWLELAELYDANNLGPDAARCYAQAFVLEPQARSVYLLGCVLWELGDVESAADSWHQAAALELRYAPVRWRLGRYHMEAGRLEEAQVEFENALELAPRDPSASLGLARCLLAQGAAQEAADQLERLLESNKRDKRALNLLARVLQRLGRSDEAERVARREQRASVAPEHDAWLSSVQSKRIGSLVVLEEALAMMNTGQVPQAIELLRGQLSLTPSSLGVWNMLLRGLVLERRFDEVLEGYDQALNLRPQHHLLLISRGRALMGLERHEQARQSFQRAAQLAPGYGECFAGLGEAYLRMGKHAAAADALLRATQLEQTKVRDWLALGQAELKARRYALAAQHAQEALVRYPLVPDLLALGAESAIRNGERAQAQAFLERLEKRNAGHVKLALLRELIGDPGSTND